MQLSVQHTGSMYGRNQRSGSVVVAPGQNGAVRVVESSPTAAPPGERLILSPAPIIDHSRLILAGNYHNIIHVRESLNLKSFKLKLLLRSLFSCKFFLFHSSSIHEK